MGNHPNVDLMVTSPAGMQFSIDVKGLYKRNFWVIEPKAIKPNLFYVLAFVPDESANQFFILDQATVNTEIGLGVQRAKANAIKSGRSLEKVKLFQGVSWSFAERFQSWDLLPSWAGTQ